MPEEGQIIDAYCEACETNVSWVYIRDTALRRYNAWKLKCEGCGDTRPTSQSLEADDDQEQD